MTDIRLRTQKDLVELAALAIGLEGPFVDDDDFHDPRFGIDTACRSRNKKSGTSFRLAALITDMSADAHGAKRRCRFHQVTTQCFDKVLTTFHLDSARFELDQAFTDGYLQISQS